MTDSQRMSQEDLDAVKQNVEMVLAPAATELAKALKQVYDTAEGFSTKSPGQQCSLLGFLMVSLAALGEGLDIFWFSGKDMMDNQISITLLITGAVLVMIGSAITGYFMMRHLADLEKSSEVIEKTKTSIYQSIFSRS